MSSLREKHPTPSQLPILPRREPDHAPTARSSDNVVVGIIKGAWGIQGDLRVERLTDNPDRFTANSRLYLEGRPVRVRRSRELKGGLRLKLDSVDDRTSAERLRE